MADASALLNYGFANFAAYTPPADILMPVPVALGRADTVQPVMQGGTSFIVEKAKADTLETHLELPESLTAPVKQGQEIGRLTVTSGGETLLEVPLAAAEAVEAVTVVDLFTSFLCGLCGAEQGAPTK